MGRRDIRERRCGCLYYSFGPPVLCGKHTKKSKLKDEKQLRKLAAEQAFNMGHDLTDFSEYDSQPGKWTAYCHHCGLIVIVYDEVPKDLDAQVFGHALTRRCRRGAWRDGEEKATEMVEPEGRAAAGKRAGDDGAHAATAAGERAR